jgi:hypothetical protein
MGNLKELRGRTQLFPQLSCAGVGLTRFRRGEALNDQQCSAQAAAKLKLLSLSFAGIGQQRQLVQPFLELRRRLRHCRAGGGPPTRIAPVGDRFFNEPRLGVMLGEELGLAFH